MGPRADGLASCRCASLAEGDLRFRRELEALGITDYFFELFDATHSAIDYRYPLGIKYLAERLS